MKMQIPTFDVSLTPLTGAMFHVAKRDELYVKDNECSRFSYRADERQSGSKLLHIVENAIQSRTLFESCKEYRGANFLTI